MAQGVGEVAAEQARIFDAEHRRVTVGIVAMIALVAFEAMAVAAAMPVAARDLDGLALYPWAFTAFLLASLFATVAAGELADRYGPARPLLGAIGVFAVGLIVSGTATNMYFFILGRLVQGLGGGAAVVAVYVVVARVFPAYLRPQVFAVMSGAWVLPSIIGPLAAGLVSEHLTWRLVFLGLLPLAVVPAALTMPALRHLRHEPTPRPGGRAVLAVGIALGAACLQYAGQHLGLAALAALAVGVPMLAYTLPRVLPAGALRLRRGLPTVVVMRGVLAGAFAGAETFVPLMLVVHRGLAPTLAGMTLTSGAIGWSAGSWWQGRAAMRTPRDKVIRVAGSLLTVGLSMAASTVFAGVPVVVAAIGWTVAGMGMGAAFSSISVLLFELSPRSEQGANSAAVQLSDGLGCVAAIGLGGVAYAALRSSADETLLFGLVFAIPVLIAASGVVIAARIRPAR